jgi:hybrid cluster-associated redox disulfide protein
MVARFCEEPPPSSTDHIDRQGDLGLMDTTMDIVRSSQPITADSRVQDVVACHPQTIAVFARHGLQCVGCYISPFHTIADTAREYAMALQPLLDDLNRAMTSV